MSAAVPDWIVRAQDAALRDLNQRERLVPRYSDLQLALADGMLLHYLAQSRAADQVRRVIAASTRPMDEDDGA